MNEEEPQNLLNHKTNCYPDSEEICRLPRLLYRIHEKPPFYLSIMLGFQHYLTMFGATMGMPLILAPIVCFDNEPVVIVSVMSTTFFCSGIVTLLQTSIGCRLPIVQGGTYTFVASIMAIMASKGDCPSKMNANLNMTSNMTNTGSRGYNCCFISSNIYWTQWDNWICFKIYWSFNYCSYYMLSGTSSVFNCRILCRITMVCCNTDNVLYYTLFSSS